MQAAFQGCSTAIRLRPRDLGDAGEAQWENPEMGEGRTDKVSAPRSRPEGGVSMGSPAAPVWWAPVHNCTLEATQPLPGSCPALSSTSQDDFY